MKNTMKLFRILFCALFLMSLTAAVADEATAASAQPAVQTANASETAETATSTTGERPAALYWAIAIVMGCGSLAAGLAVGKVGAAALGAAAEKPEILGKAIAFVGLGEGIALFGFLISMFLWLKIN